MARPNVNVAVGGPKNDHQTTYKTIVLKENIPFDSQVGTTNTKYVIKWDFDLGGSTVTIPQDCIISFDGGSLNNGTINGQNTLLTGNVNCNTTISGTFANDYLDVTWFGAKGDDRLDCTGIFMNVVEVCRTSHSDMFVPNGVFALKTGKMSLGLSSLQIYGQDMVDTSLYLDYNNIKLYGAGEKSVIKGYFNGDVVNMSWMKNFSVEDITITSAIGLEDYEASNGQNLISLIDGCNINIRNCYCHDSYWKPRMSGDKVFCDGGSGITIQGRLFHNVNISDCRIYNCFRGFDIVTTKWFTHDAKSGIHVSNIQVEKCNVGITWDNEFGYNGDVTVEQTDVIKGGLVYIEGKTANCCKGNDFIFCNGLVANIRNTSNESIANARLSGYGLSWFKDLAANASLENLIVTASNVNSPVNCSMCINSSYKYVNYGYNIDNNGRSNGVYQNTKNSTVDFKINEGCTPTNLTVEESTITGYLLNITSTYGSRPQSSIMMLNGFSTSINGDDYLFKSDLSDKSVYIIDGVPIINEAYINKLTAYTTSKGLTAMRAISTLLAFSYKAATSGRYMCLGVAHPSDDSIQMAFNGNGDIVRPDTANAMEVGTTPLYDYVAGGNGIPVRLSDEIQGIAGYVQIQKGRSKGTSSERPSLSSNDAGATYYDTTLGKLILWNGTSWKNVDGSSLN